MERWCACSFEYIRLIRSPSSPVFIASSIILDFRHSPPLQLSASINLCLNDSNFLPPQLSASKTLRLSDSPPPQPLIRYYRYYSCLFFFPFSANRINWYGIVLGFSSGTFQVSTGRQVREHVQFQRVKNCNFTYSYDCMLGTVSKSLTLGERGRDVSFPNFVLRLWHSG